MNQNPEFLVPRSSAEATPSRWEAPTVEWISLDCEISSYAPDEGDTPLF